jgi:hypothetical protein
VESRTSGPRSGPNPGHFTTARRLQFVVGMITLWLFFFTATPASAPVPAPCEQVGPRLDGTYVTICRGAAVAVRDHLGNTREWDPSTRAITVRSPGARPMVLEAAPAVITYIP